MRLRPIGTGAAVARGPRDREALGHPVAADEVFCLRARFLEGLMWRTSNRVRRLSVGTRCPGQDTRHQVRYRDAAAADWDWSGGGPGAS